jgi:hypothetical protein
MPLTGSLMFVYICIDVGDPVEERCWDAINTPSTGSPTSIHLSTNISLPVNGIPTPPLYWIANINTYIDKH